MQTDEIRLLTLAEFAQRMGVDEGKVREWMEGGKLRPLNGPDGCARIPETEARRLQKLALARVEEARLTVVPMEIHLETLRLLREERRERRQAQKVRRRLERHVLTARVQLSNIQKALAETAESQAAADAQARQQAEEALKALEEKQQLRGRIEALEALLQRVPGWVRALFGAKV